MKIILWSLIFAIAITGCKLSPKPLDGKSRSQHVNQELICAKEIHLLPVSINGAKPVKSAFNYSLTKLKRYTTPNVIVHQTIHLRLEAPKVNDFIHDYGVSNSLVELSETDRASLLLATENLPKNSTTMVMIYTPILYFGRDTSGKGLRGLAFGTRVKQPFNVVAYNQSNINAAPVITDNQAWKIVLTHEMGHRLGVPASATHNKKGHCTSRECIMYSKPDWQSVVSVFALNGMPYDFCYLCKAELLEAKKWCPKEEELLTCGNMD